MTDRERILAIMAGQSPDRIPWIPRLLIWHRAHQRRGTLDKRFEGMSLRQVEKTLGMGTPAREGKVFTSQQEGDVEITTRREGPSAITTYRTPKGEVYTRFQTTDMLEETGIGSLEVEHMIKGPDDFAVVEYLITHTRYTPTYDAYVQYEADIGSDGYPLAICGDVPIHHFLQKLSGYQAGFYHLYDYPDKVEHLLKTMEEIDRDRVWPLMAESPANLILHGVHFDSDITPPPLFEKYITPYYRDLSALLHSKGKTLSMHADNDSKHILTHIRDAGFDMAETFTTDPQATCTLEDARAVWGTGVIIWGAVPSVILEDSYSDAEFEAYMKRIFRTIAPGDAFILGVADNVMPDARLDRLERITEMVEAWGRYPIAPDKIA